MSNGHFRLPSPESHLNFMGRPASDFVMEMWRRVKRHMRSILPICDELFCVRAHPCSGHMDMPRAPTLVTREVLDYGRDNL